MNEYGTATEARTARKRHRCDDSDGRHIIAPGHRYLRLVMFPGDINSSGQPWVMKQCIACAEQREEGDGFLVGGACTGFCCGTVPCALPRRHDGDHSCWRCAAEAARAAAIFPSEVTV